MDHKAELRSSKPRVSLNPRVLDLTQMVTWLFATSVCFLFLAVLPALAQTTSLPLPENASPKSYGEGWECNIGYRLNEEACLAIVVPENAYETKRTYGSGWECLHGFRQTNESECAAVIVPDGGFLDPSGLRWHCLRGFVKLDDTCQKIDLPENAYLSNVTHGALWTCDRGFETTDGKCTAIVVPANGYLNASRYGQPWTCERGFFEQAGQCEAVAIPANAFFDDASYGSGWRCERGYAASNRACEPIDLPQNAHLDRSGNRWNCNRNFQQSKGLCVLNN